MKKFYVLFALLLLTKAFAGQMITDSDLCSNNTSWWKGVKPRELKTYKDSLAEIRCNGFSTPLHLAVQWGSRESVVRYLLKNGVAVDARDSQLATALHIAALSGNIKVATILLWEWQADPNAKDRYGETPLHNAVKGRNAEVIPLLIEGRADPNIENHYGHTPLWTAALFVRSAQFVRYLVAGDADMDIVDVHRRTLLHVVARYSGSVEVARALVELGADPTATDIYGETPAQAALDSGKMEVHEYLKSVVASQQK